MTLFLNVMFFVGIVFVVSVVFILLGYQAFRKKWNWKVKVILVVLCVAAMIGVSFFGAYFLNSQAHSSLTPYNQNVLVVDADKKEIKFGEEAMKFEGQSLPVLQVNQGGQKFQLSLEFLLSE